MNENTTFALCAIAFMIAVSTGVAHNEYNKKTIALKCVDTMSASPICNEYVK